MIEETKVITKGTNFLIESSTTVFKLIKDSIIFLIFLNIYLKKIKLKEVSRKKKILNILINILFSLFVFCLIFKFRFTKKEFLIKFYNKTINLNYFFIISLIFGILSIISILFYAFLDFNFIQLLILFTHILFIINFFYFIGEENNLLNLMETKNLLNQLLLIIPVVFKTLFKSIHNIYLYIKIKINIKKIIEKQENNQTLEKENLETKNKEKFNFHWLLHIIILYLILSTLCFIFKNFSVEKSHFDFWIIYFLCLKIFIIFIGIEAINIIINLIKGFFKLKFKN